MLWRPTTPENVEVGFAIFLGKYTVIGFLDLIGVLRRRQTDQCVVDYKTATVMSEVWKAQWRTSSQLTTYDYAVEAITGRACRENVIQILHFNKNIEKIDEVVTSRNEHELAEWRDETIEMCADIESKWNRWRDASEAGAGGEVTMSLASPLVSMFPRRTTECTKYFRKCAYWRLCTAQNPALRDAIAHGGAFDVVEPRGFDDEKMPDAGEEKLYTGEGDGAGAGGKE